MQPRRGTAHQQLPPDFAEQLRALRDVDSPVLNVLLAASRDAGWSAASLGDCLQMKSPAVSKRVERTRQRPTDPALAAVASSYVIPVPSRIPATIDGKRLAPERVAELKRMQLAASRVNGGAPVGHPSREVSEKYSAELNRLITEEGFNVNYLARVLGPSHRAITSRLERHGFREPCPSVAGTPSGLYSRRKIGDPGVGVQQLSAQQRAWLRELWLSHLAGKRGARGALATALQGHLAAGFTLANLAQAMSTKTVRVGYTALQEVATHRTSSRSASKAPRAASAAAR